MTEVGMMPGHGQPPGAAGLTARPPLTLAGFDAVVSEASELGPVSRLFAGARVTVDAILKITVDAVPEPAS